MNGITTVRQSSVDNIGSSIENQATTRKNNNQESVSTLTPATDVSISTEGLSMSLRVRRTGLQQTIYDTLDDISNAERIANNLLYRYDDTIDSDHYTMGRDVSQKINSMWQSTTASHPLRNEWSQYGITTASGKRIVTQGPQPLQKAMNALFNDLQFDSKASVKNLVILFSKRIK